MWKGKMFFMEISIIEKFKNEIENNNIIIAKVNNKIVPLTEKINDDDDVKLLDITDKDGIRVYKRGLLYIMGKAFNELYKEAQITVHYQLGDALYCEVVNMELTQEMIINLKKRMEEIIEENIEIKKIQMSKKEAEKFYEENNSSRGKLQLYASEKKYVSLYYCEKYFNYFYGVMPFSTGFMKIFDLEKFQKGFIIKFPNAIEPRKPGKLGENKKLLKALDEYEELHKNLDVHTVHKLNNVVRENKIIQTILIDEALHEKKIAEIANSIVKNGNTKVILIAGPSSSGKTTFAQRLGIQLKINGIKPVTISVDNYFVERKDTPKDENGEYDFECIEAVDLQLFNKQLIDISNGKIVKLPTFNFKTGKKEFKGNTLKLKPDEVLVVEGIHCLNDKLTESIPKEQKFKIYISNLTVLNVDYFNRISTTDSRLIRRIVRDKQFRGYSALHTLKMWNSVNKGEEKNIFPYQEEADEMFNSSLIYELGVLKPFALPILEEISREEKEYSEARRLYDFLRYFESIPTEVVPKNSLLREFIGGGYFEH